MNKLFNLLSGGGLFLFLFITHKNIIELLYLRKKYIDNKIKCAILDRLIFRHADIDRRIKFGRNLNLVHNGLGVVIHPYTSIGNNVKIYQQVTIGRGDIWKSESPDFVGFKIEDDVVICAGARIICSHGELIIRKGTVIGANSVLTKSTGEFEIWAGIPARKIGIRKD